jgi:hypothetical protein
MLVDNLAMGKVSVHFHSGGKDTKKNREFQIYRQKSACATSDKERETESEGCQAAFL